MSKAFYPGNIKATTVVNQTEPEDFHERMNNVIHKYENMGYYVELSYGGSNQGRLTVMIIAREKILIEDKVEAPVITSRFTKIKEEKEDEVSR